MPYKKGTAASLNDLLTQIVTWATDETIHGEDTWELMRNEPWPRGMIFKAKGVNGTNSCYIGILPLSFVKGTTYRNWLFNSANIGKYLIWPKTGLNLGGASFIHTNGATSFQVLKDRYDPASDKIQYSFSAPDIVNANGTALVFGVFKQYAADLDWHEQPGAISFGEMGLYPLEYTRDGSDPIKLSPPLYPGVGYPGIGMPAGQPADGYFTYWLAKDASRITVVTNNSGQWDMGHAGMLVPFHAKMQYAFPAVVTGSCTGLKSMASVADKQVINGAKIDYSYSNWDMSRSMPCTPCKNSAGKPQGVSNLGMCLPDGKWQFFHNWKQEYKTNSSTSSSGYTTYWFTTERPVRDDNSEFMLKPTNTDLLNVASNITGEETITLESFDLIQNAPGIGITNMLGTLWHMAWPGLDGPYGEITVNEKRCLLVPNCWEDRVWYVPSGVTDQATLLAMWKEIVPYGKQFRMLIRLED
ncbi:hypothetical protein [Anaerospora hongkongensis]|uniref:hypothetical protein n=1 Tax=Anaerospora hongkongensis TaxID=244830 RepID=UPI00289D080C|nr:hypothetical protein [Anaerospora hongkongensis]